MSNIQKSNSQKLMSDMQASLGDTTVNMSLNQVDMMRNQIISLQKVNDELSGKGDHSTIDININLTCLIENPKIIEALKGMFDDVVVNNAIDLSNEDIGLRNYEMHHTRTFSKTISLSADSKAILESELNDHKCALEAKHQQKSYDLEDNYSKRKSALQDEYNRLNNELVKEYDEKYKTLSEREHNLESKLYKKYEDLTNGFNADFEKRTENFNESMAKMNSNAEKAIESRKEALELEYAELRVKLEKELDPEIAANIRKENEELKAKMQKMTAEYHELDEFKQRISELETMVTSLRETIEDVEYMTKEYMSLKMFQKMVFNLSEKITERLSKKWR